MSLGLFGGTSVLSKTIRVISTMINKGKIYVLIMSYLKSYTHMFYNGAGVETIAFPSFLNAQKM